MADAFYNDIRDNVADTLIKDFGRAFIIREEGSEAVFNEETGFITTVGTNVDYAVTGVFLAYKQREIDGTNVFRNDKKILLSAVNPLTNLPLSIVPTTDMTLIDGSDQYTIVDVVTVKPGGVDVIYTVQARK